MSEIESKLRKIVEQRRRPLVTHVLALVLARSIKGPVVMTIPELAQAAGIKEGSMRNIVPELIECGLVMKKSVYRKWELSVEPPLVKVPVLSGGLA